MNPRETLRTANAGPDQLQIPEGRQEQSARFTNCSFTVYLLVAILVTVFSQPAVADCEMAWDAMGLRFRSADGNWRYFTPGVRPSPVVATGSDGKKEWTFHVTVLDQETVDKVVGTESDCRYMIGILYARQAGLMYRDSELKPLPGVRVPLVGFSPSKFSTGQKQTWMCTTHSTHFIEGKPPMVVDAGSKALPILGMSEDDLATLEGLAGEIVREVRVSGATAIGRGGCEVEDGDVRVTLQVKGDRQKRREIVVTWPATAHEESGSEPP